jgi:hypothetical protein
LYFVVVVVVVVVVVHLHLAYLIRKNIEPDDDTSGNKETNTTKETLMIFFEQQ